MAAQHIAEAHGYAGHVCAAGEGLDQHFTQALGTAHDIGGVDGLIGGELDKTLHAVQMCIRDSSWSVQGSAAAPDGRASGR